MKKEDSILDKDANFPHMPLTSCAFKSMRAKDQNLRIIRIVNVLVSGYKNKAKGSCSCKDQRLLFKQKRFSGSMPQDFFIMFSPQLQLCPHLCFFPLCIKD